MTQNNQFKFILNLAHIIKFLVPTHWYFNTIWHSNPWEKGTRGGSRKFKMKSPKKKLLESKEKP